jgi:hypothetical protein
MSEQQALQRSSRDEGRRPPMQVRARGEELQAARVPFFDATQGATARERAPAGTSRAPGSLTESAPAQRALQPETGGSCKRKLLDEVRDAIRTRHYSDRTEACLPKPGAQAGGLRRIYPAHPDLLSRKIVAW